MKNDTMAEKETKTPKESTEDSKYRAPALDKGLDILELLAQQSGGLTRSEIVSAMGRRPGEIYRMLERLVARRYVSRSQEGDRYALTLKLFLLGNAHPPLRRLIDHVQPRLDTFARDTGQSIHLAALDHHMAMVIAQASSPGNWEFRLKVGASLNLINTGSGKTLLAFQREDDRDELIGSAAEQSGGMTKTDIKALHTELEEIKVHGCRISPSAQLIGVTDISVPLLNHDGYSFGVLTCPYIERVEQADKSEPVLDVSTLQEMLVSLANTVSL